MLSAQLAIAKRAKEAPAAVAGEDRFLLGMIETACLLTENDQFTGGADGGGPEGDPSAGRAAG